MKTTRPRRKSSTVSPPRAGPRAPRILRNKSALPARLPAKLSRIAAGLRSRPRSGVGVNLAGPDNAVLLAAAQGLARELGVGIARVDLATIISKYIGETEKNLRRVFDDAEAKDVLLFFDEADALFGKRTDIKDAHDRYANLEIGYLLQRMEEFAGVVILATNGRTKIPRAFLRRLRYVVKFPPPKTG